MKRTVVTRKCIKVGSISASIFAVMLLGPVIAQAQMRWGDFKKDDCVGVGKRQYSARLWDIPWGQSWERACENMPATISGVRFNRPTRCKNEGASGMWGEFDVPDSSCAPRWGSFKKDHCPAIGVRQYSSRLDVPGRISWEAACGSTASTVEARIPSRTPNRCVNKGAFGMWGEFDVPDSSCPHWGSFSNSCASDKDNVRYYMAALLDIPPGISWEQTCQNFPADVPGVRHFDKPTMCIQQLHVYGYFAVDDPACKMPRQAATTTSDPPSCAPRPSCSSGASLSCEMLSSGSPTAKGGYPQCDEKGWYCCGGINRDPKRCPSENNHWYPATCKRWGE